MLKSLCVGFALVLGCADTGCASRSSNHGDGADLSGTGNGSDVDMTFDPLGSTGDMAFKLVQTQNGDPGYPAPAPGAGGFGGVGGSGPGPAASGAQAGVLSGAPTADATVKMLYPYNNTVWPRGLFAPLIQWNPAGRNFDA